MQPRERVLLAFDHQHTDRPPIYDLPRQDGILEHVAGQAIAESNKEAVVHTAISRSLDITRNLRYPVLAPYTATDADGFTIHHERWTRWTLDRPFSDSASLAAWARADIGRTEQIDAVQWMERYESTFARQCAAIAPTVLMWTIEAGSGFFSVANQCGLELFSYLWADEPALLSEWIAARWDLGLRKVKALTQPDLSPIAFIGEDISDSQSVMYPPRLLRQEMFPRLKETVRAFHDKGIRVVFHSDGNVMPIIGDLLACEIDGLNPIDPLGGMDLALLKERYGNVLTLIGSIDCSYLLPYGAPRDVQRQVRAHLATAWHNGGFVIGSTSELHSAIPVANVLAMWEAARQASA